MKKWIAILVGVLVIAVPLLAEAKVKCPAKPKNTVRAKRLAKKFFNKGGRLAQKEKYTAALDSFLCSLKMKPHENTVYNVAQVSKFVEDRDAVRTRLEKFVRKHPKHESRPELEELIASVEGTYQPPSDDQPPPPGPAPPGPVPTPEAGSAEEAGSVEEADSAEEVDSTEEAGSPVDAMLEEEQDTVEPGAEPGAEAGVEGEEPDDEVGELFAEEAAEPPGGSPADEPVDQGDGDDGLPPTTIAGYVLLGTAGATLITAIGLQGAAGAAKNKALDSQSYDQFTSREDEMSRMQTGATVFWVATGVIGGTGVVLLLLDLREKDGGAGEADLQVGAAPGGIVLEGRF